MNEQTNLPPGETGQVDEVQVIPEATPPETPTEACSSQPDEASPDLSEGDGDADSESGWGISIDMIETESPEDIRPAENDLPAAENDGLREEIRCLTGFLKDSLGALNSRVDNITDQMNQIRNEVDLRFKNDRQKDTLIENLHGELQQYKTESLNRQMEELILEVIRIVDDIRKITSHYQNNGENRIEPEKLVRIMEDLPAELETLFLTQGLKPYASPMLDFDPQIHKVIRKIETDDKQLDKKIARSLRFGYKLGNKIIRPEMVEVYVHQGNA